MDHLIQQVKNLLESADPDISVVECTPSPQRTNAKIGSNPEAKPADPKSDNAPNTDCE
jgi:hypothetical protein